MNNYETVDSQENVSMDGFNIFDEPRHQTIHKEKQRITITSVAKQTIVDNNSPENKSFYVYTLKFSEDIVKRRYNDFELLDHILEKLYPTVLFPAMPKKETIVDIVKQQANNSIDITSKTLYSGFNNLILLKDNLLGYNKTNEAIAESTSDDKHINNKDIPDSIILKSIDLDTIASKDLKLIRHRCIYFEFFINELIKIFETDMFDNDSNKIVYEFLNPKIVNFTEFVKNSPLINELLSKDILCINPKDALGTAPFYKYLPVLSESKPFSKFGLSYSKESLNEAETEEEAAVEIDPDSSNGILPPAPNNSFSYSRYDAFGISKNDYTDDSDDMSLIRERRQSSTSQTSDTNIGDIKTFKSESEEILLKFIERNDENVCQTNKLVKSYKKEIISKLKSILKSLNDNIHMFQETHKEYIEFLEMYNELIPGYKFTGIDRMRDVDKEITFLEGIIYFKCIEYLNILEDLNDKCLMLIKYGKNKTKQKWALKKLIKSQKLKLEHLNKKLDTEYNNKEVSNNSDSLSPSSKTGIVSSKSNHDDISKISTDDVYQVNDKPRPVEEGIKDKKSDSSSNEKSSSINFSPFMKKLNGLTTIVKKKYANSLQPSKQDLENKITLLKEIIDNLEKNEECINEDTMYVLKEVYTKSTDAFMRKVDDEIWSLIEELKKAIYTYSENSFYIWQNISSDL